MHKIKRVLTIAGSDSGGGAGIQADLKTFTSLGVYGMSVITAVTAQNTVRVHGVEDISADFVGLQFEAILSDIGVDAVKTGMLFSPDIVQIVANKIHESRIPWLVVDPVMVAKGGDRLLAKSAVHTMKKELIPLADLVTPNIPEAEILSGIGIRTRQDIREAAGVIMNLGCGAVLMKGGHLEEDAVDVLLDKDGYVAFPGQRIHTRNTHGTGCTFSAAITAYLARGHGLREAVHLSKQYLTAAIRESFSMGKGYGPLNHMVRIDHEEKTQDRR